MAYTPKYERDKRSLKQMRDRVMDIQIQQDPVLRAKRDIMLGQITSEVMMEMGIQPWEDHGQLSSKTIGQIASTVKKRFQYFKEELYNE